MGEQPADLLEITFAFRLVAAFMSRLPLIGPIVAMTGLLALPLHAATLVRPAATEPLNGRVTIEVEAPRDSARVDVLIDDRLVGTMTEAPWVLDVDTGFSAAERALRVVVWAADMRSREILDHRAPSLTVGASIDVDLVEVPLRVSGRGPFEPADFIVTENGRRQNVSAVHPARPDSHFVFVVDRSLSMRDGRLTSTLDGVSAFAAALREHDSAEVILFNHTVSAPVPMESPDLATVTPSGGTALFDALASIDPERRTIVVVISDSEDRHSVADDDTVRELMQGRAVQFFAVSLSRGNATGLFDDLAQTTGGLSVRTPDPAEGLRRVREFLDERVVLVYQSGTEGDGWRSIEVRPARRGLRISGAREGYRG